jgi:dipeptidase E
MKAIMKRLLLLSNSQNTGQGYLEHATSTIAKFLTPRIKQVLFVPFAGVRLSYDAYAAKVADKFRTIGYEVLSIHTVSDPVAAVVAAEALVVGGGNTFQLLAQLYAHDLIAAMQEAVLLGKPFIGWSAGANIACPTIKTTNDMPIVMPPSFDALKLIPFQLNPHYTEAHPPGHQGETRAERLAEFLLLNGHLRVVGLREGSMLEITDYQIKLWGDLPAKIFAVDQEPYEIAAGEPLDFLFAPNCA